MARRGGAAGGWGRKKILIDWALGVILKTSIADGNNFHCEYWSVIQSILCKYQ